MSLQQLITFGYTNYKGKYAIRTVVPSKIVCEANIFHGPDPVWLMEAFDLDKKKHRSFLLSECNFTDTSEPTKESTEQ